MRHFLQIFTHTVSYLLCTLSGPSPQHLSLFFFPDPGEAVNLPVGVGIATSCWLPPLTLKQQEIALPKDHGIELTTTNGIAGIAVAKQCDHVF